MKKFLLAVGVVLTLASCNKSGDGYDITGNIQGFEDGTKIYIVEQDTLNPMNTIRLDSAEIKNGTFEMKGISKEISLKYFQIGSTPEFGLPFIYENGKIIVDYNKEKLEDAKVTGSKNNDYFHEFNQVAYPIQNKLRDFQKNNEAKIAEIQQNNDQQAYTALMVEYQGIQEEVQKELTQKSKDFIKNKKDAFISLLLLEQLGMSQAISTTEFKDYFNALDKEVKETKQGKKVAKSLKDLSAVEIGSIAPDFTASSPEGQQVSLKNSLGKVTIIDFWASWCKPCREENPNVVKLYNQYKDKGLAIVGVSLDTEEANWKKAIADDQLTWTHVSNLRKDDPIAKQYAVTTIPSTFILDENGKIIARNLRGADLEAKIADLLK